MKAFIRALVVNPPPLFVPGLGSRGNAAPGITVLVAVLLSLAASGFASTSTEQTDAQPALPETAQARLALALQQWTAQHLAPPSGQAPAYTFALNDKRLAIPDCEHFVIDPAKRSWATYPTTSLAIDAACPEANWQRKIRIRLKKAPLEPSVTPRKVATVAVLTPLIPITKGQLVQKSALHTVRLPEHRAPQNAMTRLGKADYYAARNLRVGQTLLASDLAVGQAVVVVVKAVPARSQITADMIAIRQRAVDVPSDALGSFEGLEMLAANRLLHPGDILRKRDLTKAKLIKRGQRVSVESVGAYFRIASELVSLQDGFLGDQIELRNPGSDRRVTAIVTGAGKARSL